MPEQLAEVLGLPSVTFAKRVVINGGTLNADRQTEDGYDEVTCPLPAVISVTAGVVEPRYPSFKGIMAAKSKPIDTVTASDLGVTPVGWAGAGQTIVNVARRRPTDLQRDAGRGPRRRRDHRGRRRGIRQDRGVPREPEGHLREHDIMNIWVYSQIANGAPTTGTLELLTKARSLASSTGGSVSAFVGGDASAVAGSLAAKKRVPVTSGTMPTHGATFIILLIGTVLLVGALTFVPALALGPIAEHLMMWQH